MIKPSIIEINPTELCNRTCHFCPRGQGYPNINHNLSIEDTYIIRDRILEFNYSGSIVIAGHGEPLLNKNLGTIISTLKKTNCFIKIITNGDHLNKIDYANLFDEIIISVYEKENYEVFSKLKGENITLRKQWNEENFNNVAGWFNPKQHARKCYMPFYKMYIDWDLNVNLCCHDWTNLRVGNIKDNTLEEIWSGQIIEDIRNSLSKGKRCEVSSCKNCDANGLLEGEEHFKEWLNA